MPVWRWIDDPHAFKTCPLDNIEKKQVTRQDQMNCRILRASWVGALLWWSSLFLSCNNSCFFSRTLSEAYTTGSPSILADWSFDRVAKTHCGRSCGNSVPGSCTFADTISTRIVLSFSSDSDRSAQVRDESTREEKGENKKLEYISTEERCEWYFAKWRCVWSFHFRYVDRWRSSLQKEIKPNVRFSDLMSLLSSVDTLITLSVCPFQWFPLWPYI